MIKQVTTFTFTGKTFFNEDFILDNTIRPLTKEEDTLVKFSPLYDDTFIQQVERFQVAKITLQQRKPVDEDVLSEVTSQRVGEDATLEEYESMSEDVYRELMQYTGFKPNKHALVIIDNQSGKLLVTTNTKNTDDMMSLVIGSLEGEYEDLKLVDFEAPLIEKLLTNYLLDESKNLPDPFMLVEKVNLGSKSEFDKSPKNATISIKKEYPSDPETLGFILNRNKVVKLLQLDYDGVVELEFTNKFEIKGIKFKEDLAFEPEVDSAESLNFMSQYVLQLPVLFDIVNSLEEQVSLVEY